MKYCSLPRHLTRSGAELKQPLEGVEAAHALNMYTIKFGTLLNLFPQKQQTDNVAVCKRILLIFFLLPTFSDVAHIKHYMLFIHFCPMFLYEFDSEIAEQFPTKKCCLFKVVIL